MQTLLRASCVVFILAIGCVRVSFEHLTNIHAVFQIEKFPTDNFFQDCLLAFRKLVYFQAQRFFLKEKDLIYEMKFNDLKIAITSQDFNFVNGFHSIVTDCQENAPFKITNLQMCDPKKAYPLMMEAVVKHEDGKQYLTGKSTFSVNFGENMDVSCPPKCSFNVPWKIGIKRAVLYNISIYLKKDKEEPEYAPFVTFYEEDACAAVKKYLGDFIVEMEKVAGMEPGKCPIAKGTYLIKDYLLDLSPLPTDMIPTGYYQITQALVDKNTKKEMFCGLTEAELIPV